jgi:hypothetical protein
MEKRNREQQSEARKPFRKPRLQIYGHIRAITQSTMGGNVQDAMEGTGMRSSA